MLGQRGNANTSPGLSPGPRASAKRRRAVLCLVSQRVNKTLTREILMPIIPPGNVRTADTSINCLRLHDVWQDVRRR
jgi:hypothetical protein